MALAGVRLVLIALVLTLAGMFHTAGVIEEEDEEEAAEDGMIFSQTLVIHNRSWCCASQPESLHCCCR